MSVINTNYLALVSQNNLTKSQNALGTAIERLSSGLRINSAKDDAAGQAIANRFTSNIKGLTQAARNANDGISIAQTTEGALNEINNNLQRVRELTVQAANQSNSPSDLQSIQAEIDLRLQEITRVSEQTQFNSVKVLGAEAGRLSIQVGANDGEVINIELSEVSAATLGLKGFNIDGAGSVAYKAARTDDLKLADNVVVGGTADAPTYTLKVDNNQVTASQVLSGLGNGDAITFAGTGNKFGTAATAAGYVYDGAKKDFTYSADAVTATNAASVLQPGAGAADRNAKIDIGGTEIEVLITSNGDIKTKDGSGDYFIDSAGNLTETTSGTADTYAKATVANLTALMTGETGTTTIVAADGIATLTFDTDIDAAIGTAVITLEDGTTLTGTGGATPTGINVANARISAQELLNMEAADTANSMTVDVEVDGATETITINTSSGTTTVKDGGGESIRQSSLDDSYTVNTTRDVALHVQDNGTVTNVDGSKQYFVDADGKITDQSASAAGKTPKALSAVDTAIAKVDELRGQLGAVQNRFQSTIANLANTITNLSAARSRIEDADYAVEVSNMTRAQILQQAGTSVLAQANQVPQGVLSLLR